MRLIHLVSSLALVSSATAALSGQVSVITPPAVIVPTPPPAVAPVTVTPQIATPGAAGVVVVTPGSGGAASRSGPPPPAVQSFNVGSLSVPQMQQAQVLIQQLLANPGSLSPQQQSLLGAQLSQIQAQLGQ